jgi:CRISPR-associated protein Csb2
MNNSLTITWEYLTDYAVATDPSNREQAEWPPHPARVFMALAAAWFESDPGETALDQERLALKEEAAALRWLENLDKPSLLLPITGSDQERTAVTVYVPVNDKIDSGATTLQSAPSFTRSRQARAFPRRYVGPSYCHMIWQKADGVRQHIEALDRLCSRVSRIGHSSSLVRVSAIAELPKGDADTREQWEPSESNASAHLRMFSPGLFDALPQLTRISELEKFADLAMWVEDAELEVKKATISTDETRKKSASASLKNAKQEFERKLGQKWKNGLSPPLRLRPNIGAWSGYRLLSGIESNGDVRHTQFDSEVLILARTDGPPLPITSTALVIKAFRGAILANSGIQPIPEWVSGHNPNGSASVSEHGHLALFPVPFVGSPYADGRLLGVAIAFPRAVPRHERAKLLGPLLLKPGTIEPNEVTLRFGSLGTWQLRKAEWNETRQALQPDTWTALPGGESVWASVTPVVLNRFPKVDRGKPAEREAWEAEVHQILSDACERIGLPVPLRVDMGSSCWHSGVPRAYQKFRRLRGDYAETDATARLGEAFPNYPAKRGSVSRPQLHVRLEFLEQIVGPLMIGAGRYMGYGLLKPLRNSQ